MLPSALKPAVRHAAPTRLGNFVAQSFCKAKISLRTELRGSATRSVGENASAFGFDGNAGLVRRAAAHRAALQLQRSPSGAAYL